MHATYRPNAAPTTGPTLVGTPQCEGVRASRKGVSGTRHCDYGRNGGLVRITEHWEQTSTDVNSVTGLTIHEHNHFLVDVDLVHMTITLNGAINNAQRRGVGSVIQTTGHKVFELDLSRDPPLGSLLVNGGPFRSSDEDFCRAVA